MYQKLQKLMMKMFRQTLYHRTNHPKPRSLLIIIKKERRDKLYTIHLHLGFFVFIIVNIIHCADFFFSFHLLILVYIPKIPIMVFS